MMDALPPSWRRVKLGACLQRRKDTVMPATLSDVSVGLVGLEDIQDGGRGGITIRPTAPKEIQSLKTWFAPGDILYGKLRPYLNKVGIAPGAGICSTEIWAFRARPLVDARYATFFLASSFFVDRVASLTKGANLPRLDTDAFDSTDIPLPPLSEQQRIVDILEEAEEIRRLRAEAEAKTTELIPALFADVFGDLYSDNPCFPVQPLSSIGDLDRGKSKHRPRDAPSLYGGPYPFLQTGDVAQADGWITRFTQTYSEKGLEQSRLWPKGILAITIAANIASTAILTFNACFPDSVVGFTANQGVSVEYVRWWLLGYQKKLEAQAAQGAQKNINLAVLRTIATPVPPAELQDRFRLAVDDLRMQSLAMADAQRRLDKLSSSLAANAFSGQLTATWREAHAEELAIEARERDAALNLTDIPRVVTATARFAATASLEVSGTVSLRADGQFSDLNREQRTLYHSIRKLGTREHASTYFTAESLSRTLDGPLRRNPQAIEGHLAVLAARGLVIPLSLEEQTQDTGEFVFGTTYRLPRQEPEPGDAEDQVPDQIEDQPGDNARGRELERLAALLEQERGGQ